MRNLDTILNLQLKINSKIFILSVIFLGVAVGLWGEIEVGAVLALLMCSYWARSHVDRLHFFPATANAPNHVPSTNIEVFCFTESPSSTHKLACPPIIVLPWRWPAEITVHSCNWFSFAAGQPTLFAKNLISPLEFYWKIACY